MVEADSGQPHRRTVLVATAAGIAGAAGAGRLGRVLSGLHDSTAAERTAATAAAGGLDQATAATLEAFADTIVPGVKRYAGDVAIAGAADGPSAVVAGFLDTLCLPVVGVATALPQFAQLLNGNAQGYAQAAGLTLDPSQPPFVALPFAHRTNLAASLLTGTDARARQVTVLLATIASWAFDTAGSMDTARAIASGHPGLAWLGFPAPTTSTGVWKFSNYSYRLPLATLSPNTSPSGSPA